MGVKQYAIFGLVVVAAMFLYNKVIAPRVG